MASESLDKMQETLAIILIKVIRLKHHTTYRDLNIPGNNKHGFRQLNQSTKIRVNSQFSFIVKTDMQLLISIQPTGKF